MGWVAGAGRMRERVAKGVWERVLSARGFVGGLTGRMGAGAATGELETISSGFAVIGLGAGGAVLMAGLATGAAIGAATALAVGPLGVIVGDGARGGGAAGWGLVGRGGSVLP